MYQNYDKDTAEYPDLRSQIYPNESPLSTSFQPFCGGSLRCCVCFVQRAGMLDIVRKVAAENDQSSGQKTMRRSHGLRNRHGPKALKDRTSSA